MFVLPASSTCPSEKRLCLCFIKMEISPSSALLVALVVALASSAALAANNNQQSKNALSQNVLTGCIDDTDCKKLSEGHKYACFLVRSDIKLTCFYR